MELSKNLKEELKRRKERLGTPNELPTDEFRISIIESGFGWELKEGFKR